MPIWCQMSGPRRVGRGEQGDVVLLAAAGAAGAEGRGILESQDANGTKYRSNASGRLATGCDGDCALCGVFCATGLRVNV